LNERTEVGGVNEILSANFDVRDLLVPEKGANCPRCRGQSASCPVNIEQERFGMHDGRSYRGNILFVSHRHTTFRVSVYISRPLFQERFDFIRAGWLD